MTQSDRFAVALAIRRSGLPDRHCFVKRSARCIDYHGAWSLPTLGISASLFAAITASGSVPDSVIDALAKRCFASPIEIRPTAQSIHRRNREGTGFSLVLLECHSPTTSLRPTAKYTELAEMALADLLQLVASELGSPARVGTCIGALYQQLAMAGEVDPITSHLEVSPPLWAMGAAVFDAADAELWRRCSSDYRMLRQQQLGTDGEYIRHHTVDRFLRSRLATLSPGSTVADLGSGEGQLCALARSLGLVAIGFDFARPDQPQDGLTQSIDLRTPITKDSDRAFDLVVLSLVTQWVPDLDAVALTSARLLRGASSRVIVATVPPEFSKNGRFEKLAGRYQLVIEAPVRRPPFLTMINRCVGPVRYYPHSTPDYLNAFSRAGLRCRQCEYLYIDSMLSADECAALLRERPDLQRHKDIPAFTIFEFGP